MPSKFGQAFNNARNQGLGEFEYNGSRYSTQMGGESKQEFQDWLKRKIAQSKIEQLPQPSQGQPQQSTEMSRGPIPDWVGDSARSRNLDDLVNTPAKPIETDYLSNQNRRDLYSLVDNIDEYSKMSHSPNYENRKLTQEDIMPNRVNLPDGEWYGKPQQPSSTNPAQSVIEYLDEGSPAPWSEKGIVPHFDGTYYEDEPTAKPSHRRRRRDAPPIVVAPPAGDVGDPRKIHIPTWPFNTAEPDNTRVFIDRRSLVPTPFKGDW